MDLFAHLATGFGVALTPDNFLYCLLGAASLVLVAVAISRLFALRDPVPAEVTVLPVKVLLSTDMLP